MDRGLYGVCGRLRAQDFKSSQVPTGSMARDLVKELPEAGRSTPDAFEAGRLDPAQLWALNQFLESPVLVARTRQTVTPAPLLVYTGPPSR